MLAHGDLSLLVKAGVHWGLFGGAVANLGTRRAPRDVPAVDHRRLAARLLRDDRDRPRQRRHVDRHHRHLRRRHRRDRRAHTASRRAQGLHRRRGARRPAGGRVRPAGHPGDEPRRARGARPDPRRGRRRTRRGVTIGDCGDKLGLAGVDNGRLTFDHVRVPRENLLDRYGSVAEDGTYSSPIENDTRRFFTMLGTLVRGRISVAGAAGTATRVGPQHRHPVRPRAPPVRRSRVADRGRPDGLPRAPAPAAAGDRHLVRAAAGAERPGVADARRPDRPGRARRRGRRRTTSASSSRSPRASRCSRPRTRPGRSRSAARRAAAPATSPRTGCRS